MNLIIISASDSLEKETEMITELFRAGLKTFHLRKPKYSTPKLKKFISKIPQEFHKRIVIHSHHDLARFYSLKGVHLTKKHKGKKIKTWITLKRMMLKNPDSIITTSYNRLSSIFEESTPGKYKYVFLSPIFDSTRSKYQAGFSEHSLMGALQKSTIKIIARGGVTLDKIERVKELGFGGLAIRGELWAKENPVEEFKRYLDKFKELGIEFE